MNETEQGHIIYLSPLDDIDDDDDGKVQSNERTKKEVDSDEEPSKYWVIVCLRHT